MVVPCGRVGAMFSVTPESIWCSQMPFGAPGHCSCRPGSHPGLLPQRLPAWVYTHGVYWLRPGLEVVIGLGLLLWKFLAHAWSGEGCWFWPAPAEVACEGLFRGGHSLRPGPVKLVGSGMFLWMPLAQVCSAEVGHSSLVIWRLLAWTCPCGCSCLRLASTEVTGLGFSTYFLNSLKGLC